MYSRDETVNAILRLYQTVIRHPYLDTSALIVPPVNGWTSINVEGKNETVLDLLRHLPYLHPEGKSSQHIIKWETIPICYAHNHRGPIYVQIPAHCVCLTRGQSYMGTYLILDTNKGTITEFSTVGSNLVVSDEEYEALPEAERWKAHRTTPIVELLDKWARMYEKLVWMLLPNSIGREITGRWYIRAANHAEEELLVQQEQLEPWHVQDDSRGDDSGENEFDREQRKEGERERKHTSDIYNTYLRHGWPDHFDKERCRAELVELENRHDADEKRLTDEMNPDAALFD